MSQFPPARAHSLSICKSRTGNNSTDIPCCLVGCPAPGEFRGEKLCARGCVGVLGTFCPLSGVLLLQMGKCVANCEADLMQQAACGDEHAFRHLWVSHHA